MDIDVYPNCYEDKDACSHPNIYTQPGAVQHADSDPDAQAYSPPDNYQHARANTDALANSLEAAGDSEKFPHFDKVTTISQISL